MTDSEAPNDSNDSIRSRSSEFHSNTARSMQSQQKLILDNNSDSNDE